MEEVINEVCESNFGTAFETYKDAVKINNNIMLQYVIYYLNKGDDVQVKSKPRGSNRFVSPGAKFEFEIDIMDMFGKQRTGNNDYGLVAIDNLTKCAKVVPINNRTPAELITGLILIFDQIGTPKQLYSDEESSFRAHGFFRFMNELKIKHLQTSTHAHTVERFIRTCLDNLYRRLNGLGQEQRKMD